MPRTGWGWQVTPEELRSWVLHEDDELLVVDKPAHVLCHRSKHGPGSSMITVAWEHTGIRSLHMPTRLDRETSGVVVITKTKAALGVVEHAARAGRIRKTYYALLNGTLRGAVTVTAPIGLAEGSLVAARRAVSPAGKEATTCFEPLAWSGEYTFARVIPVTGRTHQIRVHAANLGHWVAGDKLYGPDERLFLEFLETGWTQRLEGLLGIERQALHACEWALRDAGHEWRFIAPLPGDWRPFAERAGFAWELLTALL